MRFIDLTGQQINSWYVIKRVENHADGNTQYLCRCECLVEKVIRGFILRKFKTKNCGCTENKAPNSKRRILDGKTYNELTVIEYAGKSETGYDTQRCKCSCGNEKIVTSANLVSGRVKSCGCLFLKHNRDPNISKKSKEWFSNPDNKDQWYKNRMKSIKRGKEHHLYDHNISDELRKDNRSLKFGYKSWRKAIYKKYNYRCQKCCKQGKRLHAHHFYSYKKYPDLATDIHNGICLCDECHREFHNIYGYKKYNPNSFYEFLPSNYIPQDRSCLIGLEPYFC